MVQNRTVQSRVFKINFGITPPPPKGGRTNKFGKKFKNQSLSKLLSMARNMVENYFWEKIRKSNLIKSNLI